jgi:TonB family protein
MFTGLLDPGRPKRFAWRAAALAAHIALVGFLLLTRETPIFVQPSSTALGNGSHNITPLYFAPGDDSRARPHTANKEDAQLHAPPKKVRPQPKTRPMQQPEQVAMNGDAGDKPERAGTSVGSLYSGPMSGHDVRPAYPVVFPKPPVSRDDFPNGFQGDVIVEVTIDRQGIVVDAKLLSGVGDDVDRKVMATVQNWKFNPAMMDGRPIASKHDVRFHFPS